MEHGLRIAPSTDLVDAVERHHLLHELVFVPVVAVTADLANGYGLVAGRPLRPFARQVILQPHVEIRALAHVVPTAFQEETIQGDHYYLYMVVRF
jgi:hypothetical protein